MQPAHASPSGLRTLGGAARVLAALGRRADGLALSVAARLGALFLDLPPVRRRYLRPLHRRSCALRGATVRLHRILPAHDPRSPRERARERLSFHWIEVTIRPRRRRRAPAWLPGDLALVGAAARPGRPEEDAAVADVRAVALWRNGRWFAFRAVGARVGPQRLRLLVGAAPGAREFRFRYYLELLRRDLPPGARLARPRPARRAGTGSRAISTAYRISLRQRQLDNGSTTSQRAGRTVVRPAPRRARTQLGVPPTSV